MNILSIQNLSKTYSSGFKALKDINLDIKKGEILALLGPNGAGKTTLISIICGIVDPSSGKIQINGRDFNENIRYSKSQIGLVPQELTVHSFETVWDTVSFTRGLYGKPKKPEHIEKVLKSLSLWEQKDKNIVTLSGGMKRRVLIAKALSHEPSILFLDEPTAGVDVELRKEMWNLVHKLRESGVTVILTTHYIEEAEEMADRIAVINRGEILLVENKRALMQKLGKKQLILNLRKSIRSIPKSLSSYNLELNPDGNELLYTYNIHEEHTGITDLLESLRMAKIKFRDLNTAQSSLEEIFVQLVKES
jgi:ABC-2 type transport system ATP-binding protein